MKHFGSKYLPKYSIEGSSLSRNFASYPMPKWKHFPKGSAHYGFGILT